MKRVIMILIVIFVAFGFSACNDTTTQNDMDRISNDNDTPVDAEEMDETNYDKVSKFMEEESRAAFSPYYELLDFQISNYQEKVVNGNVEATFLYKLINKNYDKDPDTVEYIKEAKESGNKNYQHMYDEYLQSKEMNFDIKVIIDENDFITLYSNIAPKGILWEETKMTDYILK